MMHLWVRWREATGAARRWRHPLVPRPALTPGLADEVEAFVNGELAEHHLANRLPIAPWMAINRLAHADPGTLRRLVQPGHRPTTGSEDEPGWAVAERSLAAVLLTGRLGACGVRRLQQEALIPFEEQMIQRSNTTTMTVTAVIAGAISALDQHRQANKP
jgi:hypothetical protein